MRLAVSRAAASVLLVVSVALGCASSARADDARPISLTIEETSPGRYEARFQTPMRGNARLRVTPHLPVGTTIVADSLVRRVAGDSLIERFGFEVEGGLVGRALGVDGLALSTRSALVTVRLRDGRVIRAVLGTLRPTFTIEPLPSTARTSWTTDVSSAIRHGLAHGLTHPAHILLALALVLAFVSVGAPGASILALGTFLVTSLAGAWIGPVRGLSIDLADAVVALVAVLAAREALLGRSRRLALLAGLAGLVHGLVPYAPGSAVAAVLGLDLAHLLVGVVAYLVLRLVRVPAFPSAVAWLAGTLAVAFALVLATRPEVRAVAAPRAALPMPIALDESKAGGGSARATTGLVTDVEAYLDVGVFETRFEVLGKLEALGRWLDIARRPGATIPVDVQPRLLEQISEALFDRLRVSIDERSTEPDAIRTGFATQDAAGTWLRSAPEVETAATALVGVTYAFRTPTIPNDVDVTLSSFPEGLAEMRARVIDPEVSREDVILPDAPGLAWTNELSEDPLPPVAAVEMRRSPVPLPVFSLLLAVLALVGCAVLFTRHRRVAAGAALRLGLAVALLVAPLLTVDVSAFVASRAVPTQAEARAITRALLENVYHAFNERDESTVHDRLALSLLDETREEAYLQNRRTLAFERVGGARTHVKAVELLGIDQPAPSEGGFETTARWTVAGSVTHFGHRHLRQNAYRARLRVVPADGTWKIQSFKIQDLERVR